MRQFDRAIMRALLRVPARDSAPADEVIEDGGKGSGNFGHKGRPGLRGGSGAGGGKAFRTEENGGYVGVTKSSKFSGIAQNARDYSDYRSFVKSLTPVQRETIQAQHKACGTQETLSQYTERLHTMLQKAKQPKVDKPKHQVVNGRDMLGEWKRRKDQFEFEINDAMNAQGFDGLPRVVSKKEFDEAVKAANGGQGFIAQRSYSAPNQETLDQYRDQLYHGEWYVNCEVGGAQYGQGMYCAADYTGTLTDGIKAEMAHYETVNYGRHVDEIEEREKYWNNKAENTDNPLEKWAYKQFAETGSAAPATVAEQKELEKLVAENGGMQEWFRITKPMHDENYKHLADIKPNCNIETITLAPDAKIVTYDELSRKKADAVTQEKARITNELGHQLVESAVQSMELSPEQRNYLLWGLNIDKGVEPFSLDEAQKFQASLTRSERNMYSVFRNEIEERIRGAIMDSKAWEIEHMDLGTFGVLCGYDAINAENHGASGSYTVILNRTKCIFLEP